MDELIWALENDPSDFVRGVAAAGLGSIGSEDAVAPLVLALENPDSGIRHLAARALGDIGEGRAVEPLILALEHNKHPLTIAAVEALGKIGDERAVEPLILALDNKDDRLKLEAVQALGEIGDERAVEPLIHILVASLSKEMEQKKALEDLGDLHDESLEEALYDSVHMAKMATQDSGDIGVQDSLVAEYFVKSEAVQSLGDIWDERDVETLVGALKSRWEGSNPQSLARGARRALGNIGGENVFKWAIDSLEQGTHKDSVLDLSLIHI